MYDHDRVFKFKLNLLCLSDSIEASGYVNQTRDSTRRRLQSSTEKEMDLEAIARVYGIPEKCHDSAYQKMDSMTRGLAVPKDVFDTYRTPMPKFGYRVHQGKLLPSAECQCPISEKCKHKPEGQFDCRSLAPEPKDASNKTGLKSG